MVIILMLKVEIRLPMAKLHMLVELIMLKIPILLGLNGLLLLLMK